MKTKTSIANISDLEDRKPAYELISKTDLVIIKYDDNVSVFYGRCFIV